MVIYLGSGENVPDVGLYISSCAPTSDSANLNPQWEVPPTPQKRKGNLLPQWYPFGKHQA